MKKSDKLGNESIAELIVDPIFIKVVTVLDVASLSILELLEYGLSRKEINWALAKGVIQFDKSTVRQIYSSDNTSRKRK